MNATIRTLTFAGVAAASVLLAWVTWYANQPNTVDGFAEVGEPFFPSFDDPLNAVALQVAVFDADASEAVSFSVKQNNDGLWVIPSHHNYPAEAADRLARTATSFIGLARAAVQSRSKEDWEEFGVVDPLDTGLADAQSRGTRVTLSDSGGNSLVDLIVGKQVPDRENTWYVREPEKNTTYIAELNVDLSAKFSDWIEPDLLKISQTDIVRMIRDNYSVDEVRGEIVMGEKLEFEKEDLKSTGTWTLKGLDEAAEEVVTSPINALARNLDQLKIVGIRPKPKGINADLTVDPDVARNPLVRQVLEADMQKQGFYIAGNRAGQEMLVSNEGELVAGTDDGVRYTLYFGEIARGSARDLEIGFADESADTADNNADESATDAADDAEGDTASNPADDSEEGPRRYLLIKVDFDDSLLGPKPTEPVAPEKPAILNEPAPGAGDAEKPTDTRQPETNTPDAGGDKPPETPATEPASNAEPAGTEQPADTPSSDSPESSADGASESSTEESSNSDEPSGESGNDDACFIDEPTQGQEAGGDNPAEPAADAQEAGSQETPEPSAATASADEPPDPAAQEEKPAAAPDTAQSGQDQPQPAANDPAGDSATTQSTESDEAAAAKSADEPLVIDPKQIAQAEYDRAMGEYEAAKRAYETDLADWTRREEEGREKADELAARFAEWYYVISAESFDKFKVARVDVVKKKEADSESGDTPGGAIPDFDFQP